VGVALGLGPTLTHGRYLLAVTLALDWLPEVTRRRGELALRVWELTPKLQLELERRFGRVSLGVEAGVSVSAIQATGSIAAASASLQHSVSLPLFAGLIGLRAQFALAPAVALRLRCDLQAFARHQRLAVDDQTLVDLGRVRGLFGVDLVWRSGQ
jgi:hypothetical protein